MDLTHRTQKMSTERGAARPAKPFGMQISHLGRQALREECTGGWLERDVFVGDFGAGGWAELFGWGGFVAEVVAAAGGGGASTGAGACGHTVAAAAEHAEIGGDNFKAGALLAFLVLPFAGLDAAFYENERAFFQVLLGDFGLLAPDDNFVPFGAFLAFAVAIFVSFVCGDGKICDGLAAGGEAGFGVAAETADEDDFVDGHGYCSLVMKAKRTE